MTDELDPEQATIADLFRLMNTMRNEMHAGLEIASKEREAIRNVLDNDTATLKQAERIDHRIDLVENQIGELAKEVRTQRRAIEKAGVKI